MSTRCWPISTDITAALGTDAVWLQSSTVGPAGTAQIVAALPEGTSLLDAPMLGTKKPAQEGKLVPLVSGSAQLIEQVRPVLDAVGAKTIEVGDELGQASALKMACNAWILSITAATAQSVALTEKQGLSGQLFLDAINGGAVDSPYTQLKGGAMLKGDFTPSFEIDGRSQGRRAHRRRRPLGRRVDRALRPGQGDVRRRVRRRTRRRRPQCGLHGVLNSVPLERQAAQSRSVPIVDRPDSRRATGTRNGEQDT